MSDGSDSAPFRLRNRERAFWITLLTGTVLLAAGLWLNESGAIRIPWLGSESLRSVMAYTNDWNRDIGAVCAGSTVSETFTFRNIGRQTLHVASVNASCGCTRSEVDRYEIEPGETCSITLETTIGRRADIETRIGFDADVFFAEYREPARLRLHVLAIQPVPPVVDLGRIPAGRVQRRTFLARDCSGGPATIAGVRSHSPLMDIHVLDASSIESERVVEILLRAPNDPGLVVARGSVAFGEPSFADHAFAIRADVMASVETEPDSLLLGTIHRNEKRTYSLVVQSTQDRPFDIESVDCSLPEMQSSWSPLDARQTRYAVNVAWDGIEYAGTLNGSLSIGTTDPNSPWIVVPFHGICVAED